MAVMNFPARPATLLLLVALIACAAVRADETRSRQFDVSGYDRIELKGSSQLEVVQGDTFTVEARGSAEAVASAGAEVHGDTLELWVGNKREHFFGLVTISGDQSVRFRVTLPAVREILVTGSGEVRADTLESEALELRVTGSGELRVDKVAAESLLASITGSGDLLLGTVLAVDGEASIKGSGDLHLDSYAGESLKAEIKGSGDMTVGGRVAELEVGLMGSGDFVGRKLQADSAGGSIMGSGDIVLRRPAQESFSVMGSGEIALVE
ncbi:GIN domain-containing protein [Microbulbifer halophilus]|uniref:GIN domain-containing protein n=2 Tax=Microbulbifer halophilus TaxID=453963 RepID=A0ABW5EA82_9GAMM|nr:DUF2807 domain-containing protein [Microbulbifer halophilus]MCW8128123.1 DUF2807 domain-containing protein [Microbulbifer halophilus]